ncbi:MAG TPA: response regulator [Gemmatimonadales bacterium]|nr:response regulator [Gemmatimonadales bacterium]
MIAGSRATRVGAGLLALATLPFAAIRWDLPERASHMALLVDVGALAVYGLIALAATPSRSVPQLRALAVLLGVTVSAYITLHGALVPELTWESTLFGLATMMGFAGLAPWPLRFHALVSVIVTAGMIWIVQEYWIARPGHPEWIHTRLFLVLLVGLAASVGVAWLRERLERAVRTSEERYRQLFEDAGDAMVLTKPSGLVVSANQAFAALVGRRIEELIGSQLQSHVEFVVEHREDVVAEAAGTWRCRVSRADGSTRDTEAALTRTSSDGGPLIQVVIRDISARLAAERHRAEQDRLDALSRMSAGMAHQFNNLLSGILTNTSLLREQLAGDERATMLDEIAEAVRRGRTLTKALQRFTQHSALTLSDVEPASVVESAAALIRMSLPRHVAFEAVAEPGLPRIAADQDHMVQALFELAINALRAMENVPAPALSLTSKAIAAGRVRFTVRDNGIGMDEATRAKALEPFFSTRPMFESAGLGLASVYWVARAHGGSVEIESAPGAGTAVHLDIPVSQLAATGPAASGREMVVLVVDDEESVRRSLHRVLLRLGYRVLEAADGPASLQLLDQHQGPVDLVILDIVLPGGGVGLLREIRRRRPDSRVLLSSGYGPEGEAAVMLAAGAHGFLQKPYDVNELREAVERVRGSGFGGQET